MQFRNKSKCTNKSGHFGTNHADLLFCSKFLYLWLKLIEDLTQMAASEVEKES